ncbi:hypothetical protein HDE70_002279 [Pedobacter cryoconitis]|nr:hypothetical protein [Pedobacter cryoconitis]
MCRFWVPNLTVLQKLLLEVAFLHFIWTESAHPPFQYRRNCQLSFYNITALLRYFFEHSCRYALTKDYAKGHSTKIRADFDTINKEEKATVSF